MHFGFGLVLLFYLNVLVVLVFILVYLKYLYIYLPFCKAPLQFALCVGIFSKCFIFIVPCPHFISYLVLCWLYCCFYFILVISPPAPLSVPEFSQLNLCSLSAHRFVSFIVLCSRGFICSVSCLFGLTWELPVYICYWSILCCCLIILY